MAEYGKGFMSIEEMEAREKELMEQHEKGELDDDAYAAPVEEDEQPEGAAEQADEEQPEGASKEEPEEEEKTFETEGLDDVSQNRVKAAQARMHQATQEAANLRKEIQQMREYLKREEERPDQEVKQATKRARDEVSIPAMEGMTPEEIARLSSEYPDLGQVFKVVGGLQDINAALRDQVERMKEQQADITGTVQEDRAERGRAQWMSAITEVHHDAASIQGSDEWKGWVDTQPVYIQRAVYEGATAKDMVDIISRFKGDMGISAETEEGGDEPAPQRSSKLEQARRVASPNLPGAARQHVPKRGQSGKIYTQAEIDKKRNNMDFLTSPEGEKWAEEIDKAYAEGRVR